MKIELIDQYGKKIIVETERRVATLPDKDDLQKTAKTSVGR